MLPVRAATREAQAAPVSARVPGATASSAACSVAAGGGPAGPGWFQLAAMTAGTVRFNCDASSPSQGFRSWFISSLLS